MTSKVEIFEKALSRRKVQHPDQAIRVFHGPGDGDSTTKNVFIDKYGSHAWVSVEGDCCADTLSVLKSLLPKHFESGALVVKRRNSLETKPSEILFGSPPPSHVVSLDGAKYEVQMLNQRNPGLFLDMEFCRHWLHRWARGLKVLNLFSYTGGLSVSAGLGGAESVTAVDLSRKFQDWSRRNWLLNDLKVSNLDLITGDCRHWLSKFKKLGRKFDVIICDPPSFSRGSKGGKGGGRGSLSGGDFSVEQTTTLIHRGIFEVISEGGFVLSTTNSEKLSREKFLGDISAGALQTQRSAQIICEIGLPESFPTGLSGGGRERYLKGYLLRL